MKKQKGKQRGQQEEIRVAAPRPARRKTKSRNVRMTLGLERPVIEAWTLDSDGCRRSARINKLHFQRREC